MTDKGKKKQEAKDKTLLTNKDEAIDFIDDAFKLEAYQYVEKYQSLFSHQPLEFVKYLFSTCEWILANKEKPLEVSNKLESLPKEPLDNEYKYLLEKLVELLEKKSSAQFVNELMNGKNKKIEDITKIVKEKSDKIKQRHEIWYLKEEFIVDVEKTINSDIPIFEKLAFVREKQRKYNLNSKTDKYYFDRLLDFSIDKLLAIDEESLVLDLELLRRESEAIETNLDEKLKNTLTARQWLIAMSFFTKAFKLFSTIDKINFSRLLTVLNDGKNFQEFRTKLDAKDLITTKTITDAQAVADLFRQLKLTQIAESIETAINNIKDRKL